MDVTRVREDFEGLTPGQQLEFMASVGPTFCRKMMADPALRRQMMARCLRADACSLSRVARTLQQAGIMAAALAAGVKAAANRLTRGAPPAAAA